MTLPFEVVKERRCTMAFQATGGETENISGSLQGSDRACMNNETGVKRELERYPSEYGSQWYASTIGIVGSRLPTERFTDFDRCIF